MSLKEIMQIVATSMGAFIALFLGIFTLRPNRNKTIEETKLIIINQEKGRAEIEKINEETRKLRLENDRIEREPNN